MTLRRHVFTGPLALLAIVLALVGAVGVLAGGYTSAPARGEEVR